MCLCVFVYVWALSYLAHPQLGGLAIAGGRTKDEEALEEGVILLLVLICYAIQKRSVTAGHRSVGISVHWTL